MRIWDINPGYLNNKSLLGEHAQLHFIFTKLINNQIEYSNHPEKNRWIKFLGALSQRHKLIVSEMDFRGFKHHSPIKITDNNIIWPSKYLVEPFKQFDLLSEKYKSKNTGRIPLPISAQNLWSQHKYSVMARDLNKYKEIGHYVSNMKPSQDFSDLSKYLVELLRIKPSLGGIRNSIQHMWGHFKKDNKILNINSLDMDNLLSYIQKLAHKDKYILESTALSELRIWI